MRTTSYKDLIVWQKAVSLSVATYELTKQFPKEELFGLTSQMRRCSISIPSNIAEGRFRGSKKDYLNFLRIAYASGAELETQIIIAKQLPFKEGIDYNKVEALLSEVMRMLNAMIRNFNPNSQANEANEAAS
ncbi:MAG: four helix bundle protein [bacterium]|nr:four helix bundle protein [bacterium]